MKHFTDWPQQTRTVQTLTVQKRRKDCGFTRDLFLSAGKDSGRSTRAFFCLSKDLQRLPNPSASCICNDIILPLSSDTGGIFKSQPSDVSCYRLTSICLSVSPDVSWYEYICLVKALKLLIPAHTTCLLMTGWIRRSIR